jgi:hypothetical protein
MKQGAESLRLLFLNAECLVREGGASGKLSGLAAIMADCIAKLSKFTGNGGFGSRQGEGSVSVRIS